jgi:hypothetical protein
MRETAAASGTTWSSDHDRGRVSAVGAAGAAGAVVGVVECAPDADVVHVAAGIVVVGESVGGTAAAPEVAAVAQKIAIGRDDLDEADSDSVDGKAAVAAVPGYSRLGTAVADVESAGGIGAVARGCTGAVARG